MALTEAAVSQHLKILKNVGLVTGERKGYFMHHQVNQNLLKQVANNLVEMSEILQTNSSSCSAAEREKCALCGPENLKI